MRIVLHVEDCLIKANFFNLLNNLAVGEGIDWNVVIEVSRKFRFDTLEKQEKRYRGKKSHTFKVQALIYYKTQQILSLYMSKSTVHDLELFKWNLNLIPTRAFVLAYKDYQGSYAFYPDSLLSSKTKRYYELAPELKLYDREINKRKISIEHAFGNLKTFKIFSEHHRNRGKRIGLKFNLITGIYNMQLRKNDL